MYAVRKIKDTYRANKTVQDFNEIDALAAKAKDNLELIRRQVSRVIRKHFQKTII